MPWWGQDGGQRVAYSLHTLWDQVNAKFPGRSQSDDGTIGDTAHQATKSDHNPASDGIVRALDITHDPAHGCDTYALADVLRQNRDPRIKYLISNRRICGDESYASRNGVSAWTWETYTGSNPHDRHMHVSVNVKGGDDTRPWVLARPVSADPEFTGYGKGSWYSWFTGKYVWEDKGDKKGSNALGVPDECQGISFYDIGKLGDWYEVLFPNGVRSTEQRTETGPAPWTGRLIDISAVCAERVGYTPKTYPTDAIVRWRPIDPPAEVAGLSRQQQAITYYKLRNQRKVDPVPDPVPTPTPEPMPAPVPQFDPAQIAATMAKLAFVADKLATITANVAANKTTVDLTFLTKLFPSLATHGSLWSYVILCLMQVFGTVGTATGATATPTGSILTMLLAGVGGSGLLSMISKILKPT